MPTADHTPEWRFKHILRSLGTAGDIRWMLFNKGYQPPPEDTIQGWRNRNSVPGKWVPVVIELAQEHRLIRDVSDLRMTA